MRGAVQTLVVSADRPEPEIRALLAENADQLTLAYQSVDPTLAENVTALTEEIRRLAAAAKSQERGIADPLANPKSERDLKQLQAWYDAVGAVTLGLGELSRSIGGEARMADAVIGEYILARADAPRALVEAAKSAKQVVAKSLAERDAAYAGIGGPNPMTSAGWQQSCAQPFDQVLQVATTAIAGMAQRAADRLADASRQLVRARPCSSASAAATWGCVSSGNGW